jgi:hypothetical protein
MTWHCKSCDRNFFRDPRKERTTEGDDAQIMFLFCPYCKSDKIENISK